MGWFRRHSRYGLRAQPVRLAPPPYDNFATAFPGPIVSGDFNHSGHLGLAVGLYQNESSDIFLGQGDGTLSFSTASIANSLGDPATGMAVADANGDGNLDIAFSNQVDGQDPLDLGYGDGAFTPAGELFFSTGVPTAVAFGDFNADGKLDVITSNGSLGTDLPYSGYTVALGTGDGNFNPGPGTPTLLGANIWGGQQLAISMVDGKLDVAFIDRQNNNVFVALGNGDGTFGPAVSYATGQTPNAILTADFNNDGKLDLAIANSTSNTVTLLLGNGDGTFTQSAFSPYPNIAGFTASSLLPTLSMIVAVINQFLLPQILLPGQVPVRRMPGNLHFRYSLLSNYRKAAGPARY